MYLHGSSSPWKSRLSTTLWLLLSTLWVLYSSASWIQPYNNDVITCSILLQGSFLSWHHSLWLFPLWTRTQDLSKRGDTTWLKLSLHTQKTKNERWIPPPAPLKFISLNWNMLSALTWNQNKKEINLIKEIVLKSQQNSNFRMKTLHNQEQPVLLSKVFHVWLPGS